MKVPHLPSSFLRRMHYRFDQAVSRGPLILGLYAALLSLLIVAIISLGTYIGGLSPDKSFIEILWDMLLQALAPNPVDFKSGPASFLLMMLFITLLGIFLVSIFIGIITAAIDDRVQSLRRGRSQVLEKNHTVLLGWDEHIFTIISELVIANQNQKRSSVVILGEKDKLEMEEEIRKRVGPTGNTEIICRSGNPIDVHDLEIASLHSARSIIVLPPDGEDGDSSVIKTLLAITHVERGRAHPYHIVTEIHDPFNLEPARLAGKGEVTVLPMSDIIAHITAQTCRQSGLSIVYTELLNFEGDEMYLREEPSLVGRTFGEALMLYETSTVVGIRPASAKPKLNPPMDTRIAPGDQIIAISADDDTVQLSGKTALPIQTEKIALREHAAAQPERTLILGWNDRADTIIDQLDQYAAAGSCVLVVTENEPAGLDELRGRLKHQSLEYVQANIADRRALNRLEVSAYDHVVLLADLDDTTVQLADARTLIALLHLRDINTRAGGRFTIVSEMLDVRNRNLARVTHSDDFIVSDELASLILAQISEEHNLYEVFEDLFYPEGSEIYLKPATDYVLPGSTVNFYTLTEAARCRGEVAIGYRKIAEATLPEKSFGIVVNPNKAKEVTFDDGDKLIVLAER